MQDNIYAVNEASCFGTKQLNAETNELKWTLKKHQIDLLVKNQNVDSLVEVNIYLEWALLLFTFFFKDIQLFSFYYY